MKKDKPKPPRKKSKPAEKESPLGDAENRRMQLRVAKLRDKIRHALDDPNKREQLVEAIRVMMRDDKQ